MKFDESKALKQAEALSEIQRDLKELRRIIREEYAHAKLFREEMRKLKGSS